MSNYSDGYIYVDYAHMNNAADDMVHQTDAIAKILSQLEMELNELRNSWIGDDRDEYELKQTAWNNAVEKMKELLLSNATLLTDVSGNYRHTQNSLTDMWSSVRIGA
ncbi:WXG100 family type VII secretion target [Streptomyces sp. NPDC098781]|uniref:WXG100 family type VII secretion target n=1 Tax=Streptomyces sp. NPDC098781 TaxID=3366097 RepID=UPI00380B2CAF